VSGDIEIHDPFLFAEADGFRIFGSGMGVQSFISSDGRTWVEDEPVFSSNPPWIADILPDASALWSPSVARFGGRQHLYYAASVFGQNRSCIGHATRSLDGKGPFVDQGKVQCSNLEPNTDDFNAIDPSPFVEETGEAYLVFGSYQSGIKLLSLDSSGDARAEHVAIARRTSDTPAIQAPSLMKWGNVYYLFVSFDACCEGVKSTHRIMFGRSDNIEGPYVDDDGDLLLEGGGTELLASDDRYKGPGSSEIYTNGNTRWLVYHAYDVERDGRPVLRISELFFDETGTPVTTGP
jgi:arabinan endo-1,5-alpha-L-arabinosidase